MSEAISLPDFNSPISQHARKDFPLLDAGMSVAQALERIRREGVGERVIYFFATDSEKRLVGVLPTRRLLTAPLDARLDAQLDMIEEQFAREGQVGDHDDPAES